MLSLTDFFQADVSDVCISVCQIRLVSLGWGGGAGGESVGKSCSVMDVNYRSSERCHSSRVFPCLQ